MPVHLAQCGERIPMKTEQKPVQQNVNIETMSSEQLALMLNRIYQTIMACQQDILNINRVLEQRQLKNTPDKGI